MTIKAKICGITSEEAIKSAIAGGADYIGFIFFPKSPRNIKAEDAVNLAKMLPEHIKTVAVFVDPSDDDIENMLRSFKPDYIQCHGHETTERLREIRTKFALPIIKAIAVRNSDDVASGKMFSDASDMLLFDAKVPDSPLPGGNGLVFDWKLLQGHDFSLPWFLSGGLNPENVAEAIKISGAKAVDVSSSLEYEPGKKDPKLVREFLRKVKEI